MVRVGTVVRTLILCGLALTTLAFAKTNKNTTIVTYPSAFAVSQPVSDLPINESLFAGQEMPEPRTGPVRSNAGIGPWQQEDSVLQKEVRPFVSATQGIDFDGISSPGYAPSDSNMAIGPNHIVETVNVQFAVYNKSGATLAGPTNILSLFTPLGGECAANTYGDPVVLYDRPADRWLISYIGSFGAHTAAECIAVSKTNDPTGSYYLYGYSFGSNLNDYPKLSTWATASNSAYLANYNIFQNFAGFIGADLCGFDRTKMLAGNSTAAQLCKMTPNTEGSYLPSDIDGPTTPPDGTPGLYISWQNNSPGQLYLRKLTLNFATATATLSSPTAINVADFTVACGACVPQLGTTQTLDTLSDRVMYRFAIRHFADHDRAVVSHAVANGAQVAVRWYELYDPAGSVTLNQQGTFAPDTTYRWMSSIAEDQNGDIGLGYSVSSSSIHPGIRFTGRVPSDPAGTMETEASMLVGAGSQIFGLARWGDYTAMQVDPSDDCTFWYVDQYEKVSGSFNWHTNIVEEHFVEMRFSVDLAQWPDRDPWRRHGNDDCRYSSVFGHVQIGTKDTQTKIAVVRAAGPDLLTVDHEHVIATLGSCPDRGEVGAGIWLAPELAPDLVSAEHRPEVALPLRIATVSDDRGANHSQTDAEVLHRDVVAGQLLTEDDGLKRARPAPSVFSGPGERRPSGLGELALPRLGPRDRVGSVVESL